MAAKKLETFKGGLLYRSKKTGTCYVCHGTFLSYEHDGKMYSIPTKNFKIEEFEEIVFGK